MLAVLAGAMIIALVTTLIVSSSGPTGPRPATGPVIVAAGPVLTAYPPTSVPLPTTAGLTKALAGPLKQANLGTHVSVEVADMATGKLLYGHGATSPTTPASTMKLATTLAVLATRGASYRITTHVVAGPLPGEVVLVGAGDPTLAATSDPTYAEGPSMAQLANQVKQSLGGIKPTKLIIDTSLFPGPTKGPLWEESDVESQYLTRVYALTSDGGRINPSNRGDSPRYRDSATGAGAVFAKDLGLPASAVTAGKAARTPAVGAPKTTPGAVLGSVQSAPLGRIIEDMLTNSDNMLAEFMARQVALATGYPASFAGASAAVTHELTKLGIPMQGAHIVDGSGISHLDRLTPALLTAILAYASSPAHPAFHAMFTGFPVAGYSGTLANRFRTKGTTDAVGMLRAKTGTLNFTNALAGYVIDESGRPLILVVLLDKTPWTGARTAVDKIGAAVRACGCGTPAG
ncbi:MAG TPA: D-alanyl-D-alanine carboxypeptidase/D-alanyl-D-alanine-endopeptidase [Micromonosporaceae bacterium]